jgi:hypothetical protein
MLVTDVADIILKDTFVVTLVVIIYSAVPYGTA